MAEADRVEVAAKPAKGRVIPEHLVTMLKSWIKFPTHPFSILDVRAENGANILTLASGTNATVYAVSGRTTTRQCREAFALAKGVGIRDYRVTKGTLGDVRISREAFSLVWCNLAGAFGWESSFLRRSGEYLRAGGLMVVIVPQERLGEIARYMAAWYSDLKVLRFPDPDFEEAHQVAVLGVRRRQPERDKTVEDSFRAYAELPPDFLQEIQEAAEPVYQPVESNPQVSVFMTTIMDAEEALELSRTSPVWNRSGIRFNPPVMKAEGRPPTPLHSGHIALLMASGAFNGVMGTGDQRHLVAGQVTKEIVVTEESEMEEGVEKTIETETEQFKVNITLLTPDGIFKDLC